LVWLLIPYLSGFISIELGLLFWGACTSLGVYTVIIAGWSSNSGYSLLGGLRALAQTIFYEVRLAFIFLSFVVLICRYNLAYFYSFQDYLWLIFLSLPDNTLHSQQRVIHVPEGIRTRNSGKRAATDLRLRPRGQ